MQGRKGILQKEHAVKQRHHDAAKEHGDGLEGVGAGAPRLNHGQVIQKQHARVQQPQQPGGRGGGKAQPGQQQRGRSGEQAVAQIKNRGSGPRVLIGIVPGEQLAKERLQRKDDNCQTGQKQIHGAGSFFLLCGQPSFFCRAAISPSVAETSSVFWWV